MALRLARELRVPAPAVMSLPARWLGAALTALEGQRVEAEQAQKRHRRGAGKPAANPRSRR